VEDLPSLVVELKEEVEGLRSIRDCGKGIGRWSCARPSLQEGCGGDAFQAVGDHLLSRSQVGTGDLKDSEGWKQVPARGNKRTAPQPVPPSQVPLHNRYEALELEGLGDVDVGESPSVQERLPKAGQSAPRSATVSVRKKRRAVVIGDSLLRVTEDPMCCLDPSRREVCCLPGARVRGIARNITRLVKPSDYYPLLSFHIGNEEIGKRSPRVIRRDFRGL